MNLRLERYVSGAGLLDRMVHPGRGRRVMVMREEKILRSVARFMAASGKDSREISRALCREEALIQRLLRV